MERDNAAHPDKLVKFAMAPARLMREIVQLSFSRWHPKEKDQLDALAYFLLFLGGIAFILLVPARIPSVYGRYSINCSSLWGFKINGKLAWVVQECPNVILGISNVFMGRPQCTSSTVNQVFMALFLVHYFNRTFVYPLQIRGGKPTPFSVFGLAFFFCILIGHLQMRNLASIQAYDESWFVDPRFGIGLFIFFTGMYINLESDHILRNLRRPGETGYKIPRGGAFRLVSGANFFGEILEWTGFAIAQWNLPAASFAVFTFLNTAPRAWHHHRWYKEKFPEYPKHRWAVIPFIW